MAEITSTTQDYLKLIWSATEWNSPPITVKALSERLGTTRATVSDTIKRLAAQGMLIHEPYQPITLTADGERHALVMVRRHRLIETFLVTSLGYGWDEIHDEAEHLEHAVSDLMTDRIDTRLGHPGHDPHGDPIPSKDGTIVYPHDATRLSNATPGRYTILRVSDANSARLVYFQRQGLVPGAHITMTADEHAHTLVLDTPTGTSVTLAPPATHDIVLAPI